MDYVAGATLIAAGVMVFILESVPFTTRTEQGYEVSPFMKFGTIVLSFLLVVIGCSILVRLRHVSPLPEVPAVVVPRKSAKSVPGQKCPKPNVPPGPIHVLHVREEALPEGGANGTPAGMTRRSGTSQTKTKQKNNNSRTTSRASCSDDISLTGLLDLSTSVGDQTPMTPCPMEFNNASPSAVPDTIAAIWETVPNGSENNIWLRPEPT